MCYINILAWNIIGLGFPVTFSFFVLYIHLCGIHITSGCLLWYKRFVLLLFWCCVFVIHGNCTFVIKKPGWRTGFIPSLHIMFLLQAWR